MAQVWFEIKCHILFFNPYIFNGFKSVTSDENGILTGGLLGGANGLRGGRQKGIESTINSPNLSLKFDYYGLPGLRLGLSGYFGKTQAPDDIAEATIVGIVDHHKLGDLTTSTPLECWIRPVGCSNTIIKMMYDFYNHLLFHHSTHLQSHHRSVCRL